MSLTHNDLDIVAQVMAILNKEYKYNHSHARLANRFHICESKLRKIFKQANNKTINNYLIGVRIEHAKELLCDTDDPIKKIASSVGYYVPRNLEKQFKICTGMTPLDWKNKHRQHKLASQRETGLALSPVCLA
jgi:YesN/AraC family two-component response regulator